MEEKGPFFVGSPYVCLYHLTDGDQIGMLTHVGVRVLMGQQPRFHPKQAKSAAHLNFSDAMRTPVSYRLTYRNMLTRNLLAIASILVFYKFFFHI